MLFCLRLLLLLHRYLRQPGEAGQVQAEGASACFPAGLKQLAVCDWLGAPHPTKQASYSLAFSMRLGRTQGACVQRTSSLCDIAVYHVSCVTGPFLLLLQILDKMYEAGLTQPVQREQTFQFNFPGGCPTG